jgi:hypothetical protein
MPQLRFRKPPTQKSGTHNTESNNKNYPTLNIKYGGEREKKNK